MSRRSYLVPEVVQTSAMDCGPASLDALLTGFGIDVNYGRLREACQTDVDGTSIDTLEDVAVALGLDAEQVVTPVDHLLLSESRSLPALAVVRLPNGVTHFVIIWRVHGPWVQVMDPGSGRVWMRKRKLLAQLYVHKMAVEAAAWREWAGGEHGDDDFLAPLRVRLAALGGARATHRALVDAALADPSAGPLACLDAALRMVTDIVETGGLRRGPEALRTLERLLERMQSDDEPPTKWVPERYWSAAPVLDGDPDDEAAVYLRGAVTVRVLGRRDTSAAATIDAAADEADPGPEADAPPIELPPDLACARDQDTPRPGRTLLRMILSDGWLTPSLVITSLLAVSFGMLIEAAILRGLVELGSELGLVRERLVAWIVFVAFAGLMLLLESVIAGEMLGIGRRLEARLRVAFLSKVPRLGARYFQSRLSSDMAERIHAMHSLRRLPQLGAEMVRSVASLVLTVCGIAWLDPGGAAVGAGATLVLIATTFIALPTLSERDLRFRTHGGALSRTYLDAFLGLVPIRTHGAARSVRREHEQLLVEWMRAGLDMIRTSISVSTIQAVVGFVVVITITMRHSLASGEIGAMLLLIYWSLMLPTLGQRVGELVRQYPGHRSRALRLLEPIGAPDEDPDADFEAPAPSDPNAPARGVALSFSNVHIRAAGHSILEQVELEIGAGEHLAIVGPSGAGKSSLVSLLLGWHRAAEGEVRVDGELLDGSGLARLRRHTAWVDPAIALWNKPLVDNLLYGSPDTALDHVGEAMEQGDLLSLVANLPEGLQTELGEGGAMLSGGEGQRVRLGRALLRPDVRLVILDEPLRGLDRERRRVLMRRIRAWFPHATLLCVTHDLEETREFPRVVVVEAGRIVEDAPPEQLLADPHTCYATMLERERSVHAQLWGRSDWRRVSIHSGQLHEQAYAAGVAASPATPDSSAPAQGGAQT